MGIAIPSTLNNYFCCAIKSTFTNPNKHWSHTFQMWLVVDVDLRISYLT